MGVRRVSLIQQTFTKSARASANRILYIRVRMTQCRVQVTYLQPPLKDFVGLCWSASSNPSPRNVLESYPPSQGDTNLPTMLRHGQVHSRHPSQIALCGLRQVSTIILLEHLQIASRRLQPPIPRVLHLWLSVLSVGDLSKHLLLERIRLLS